MSTSIEEIAHLVKQHPRLVIAEDYEIAVQRHHTVGRKFRNGSAILESEDESFWISLRLLHRKQPGRSSTTLCSKEALAHLVESAFESARRASVDPWFRFPIWKQPKKQRDREEPGPPLELESDFDSLTRVPHGVEEVLENWDTETYLLRKSEKFALRHKKLAQVAQLSVIQQLSNESFALREERALGGAVLQRAQLLQNLVDQSFELTQSSLQPAQANGSLLFSPQVNAALLKRLAPYFFADHVQNGKSPFSRLNDLHLFSSALTIVDDGDYAGAAQASPFDMEGALTQSTLLVHHGKVADYLYDTYTATRENRLSTGNFVRAPQGSHSRVGASTFYVLPSPLSRADLVSQLHDGTFVQCFHSIEPLAASETRFLLRGAGWKIQQGRFAEPLLNIEIPFDLIQLFKLAKHVGNDLDFFGSFGAPSILYESPASGRPT